MSAPLLQIEGLSVRVEDKEILHGIDLQIKKGETHVPSHNACQRRTGSG